MNYLIQKSSEEDVIICMSSEIMYILDTPISLRIIEGTEYLLHSQSGGNLCKQVILNLVEAWYSLEQYIGLKEDKLSSTTVDFIRSEGNLETKHLYWFSKPKMC